MWERLLTIAFACPTCVLGLGRMMFSLGTVMIVLGLRVDRVFALMAARTGADPSAWLNAWPWWLRVLVPDSAAGVTLAGLCLLLGLLLIWVGRWARRLTG